jgi:hypothetical protein
MNPSTQWALLVAYGYTEEKRDAWLRFLHQAGFSTEFSVVLDNQAPVLPGVLPGSNLHYEFSGYREILSHVSHHVQPEDQVFLFNDTLFTHHWVAGWARLIARRRYAGLIMGDIRHEPVLFEGRPLTILASWHFALRGTEALQLLQSGVEKVLDVFEQPIDETAYQDYLANYLKPRWWRGYTRVLTPEARLVKEQCIWAEHRLGRYIEQESGLRAYPGNLYPWVHRVDRLLAAKRRIQHLWTA